MKNEFAIAEIPTGVLNAVVKNIMKQTGEDDAPEAVRLFNSGEWILSKSSKPPILRLISGGKNITIRATSGKRTIAQSKEVFTWGIDSNFTNYSLDVPGEEKPETPVEVHEMVKDANFKDIFNSLGRNLDELCFSQEQIIAFVEDNKKWLRKDGYGTFFLVKKGNEFFVVFVLLDSYEWPFADLGRFSYGHEWHAYCKHRVLVPQQKLVA